MNINTAELLAANILIVDDEINNVQLLEQTLKEAGYKNVTTTLDPHPVSALHRANCYDLILLDLNMPGMDGFAVMEVRLLYRQLEVYNHELEALALHDALTGLPNRRLLMDRLALAIAHARRNKQTMAVLFLDLDGFKQIHDTLGHDVGDAVLKIIADGLVATTREVDTVARFGGDEFVIGLWELTRDEDLDVLMAKLMQVIGQPGDIQGYRLSISASIGVSIFPQHGEDGESLIKSADLALHEAKRFGKNNYRTAERIETQALMSGDASGHPGLSPDLNKRAG